MRGVGGEAITVEESWNGLQSCRRAFQIPLHYSCGCARAASVAQTWYRAECIYVFVHSCMHVCMYVCSLHTALMHISYI